MKISDLIGGCLGAAFIFCLMHFTMNALIKSQLMVNPNQKDGFLFRLKAAKAPIILLFLFIGAIYSIPLLGYVLVPKSRNIAFEGINTINKNVLIVVLIALPAIFYNLLNYRGK